MSKQIDVEAGPLNEFDRQYLIDRNRLADVARNDELFGTSEEPVTVPEPDPAAEQRRNLLAKAGAESAVPGGSADPVAVGAPEPAEEPEPASGDYEDMTNEQLRRELGRRGLSTGGKKADLVDRLYADDEKDEDEE